MSGQLIEAYLDPSLVDLDGDKYLRVLIFTAEGKHFCAGADINMMRDAGARSVEEIVQILKDLIDYLTGFGPIHVSQLVVFRGFALGGGAGLVSCFDYAIA